MATKTYSLTEGRAKLCEMVRETGVAYDHFVLTKGGKPKAVLMSYDEYEGWLETLDIMRDPKAVPEILKRFEDVRKGRAKLIPASKIRLTKR